MSQSLEQVTMAARMARQERDEWKARALAAEKLNEQYGMKWDAEANRADKAEAKLAAAREAWESRAEDDDVSPSWRVRLTRALAADTPAASLGERLVALGVSGATGLVVWKGGGCTAEWSAARTDYFTENLPIGYGPTPAAAVAALEAMVHALAADTPAPDDEP